MAPITQWRYSNGCLPASVVLIAQPTDVDYDRFAGISEREHRDTSKVFLALPTSSCLGEDPHEVFCLYQRPAWSWQGVPRDQKGSPMRRLITLAVLLLVIASCGEGADPVDTSTTATTTNTSASTTEGVASPDPTVEGPEVPEGKIAFHSDRDGNGEIYVMNADGSGLTNLTNNPADDCCSDWSPDGSRIAFSSNRDANDENRTTIEIYVMDADGSNQTRLTNNRDNDSNPAWSPDGSRIAFSSNRESSLNIEVFVMDADGSNQTNLTNTPGFDGLFGIDWSPDGSRIAFYSDRDDNREIYVMNADGSDQTNLTNSPANDVGPDWSPDGSRIAFTSMPAGTNDAYIYVMDADGSNQTRLSNGEDGQEPAWSPDGSRIAFRGHPGDIFIMDADGSNATNLTDDADFDTAPTWSPAP